MDKRTKTNPKCVPVYAETKGDTVILHNVAEWLLITGQTYGEFLDLEKRMGANYLILESGRKIPIGDALLA